jgi:DNA-damage-inducible protein J
MKTATIRARTEPRLKADAERVFRKLGISSSEAINLFYSQVRLRKGLPFPVEIPNAVTRQTFEKTDRGASRRNSGPFALEQEDGYEQTNNRFSRALQGL